MTSDGQVIDAELAELLHVLDQIGEEGARLASAGIGSRFPDDRQLLVITSNDSDAVGRTIERSGGRILDRLRSVVTAELPLKRIQTVAKLPGVLEVRLSRRLSQKLDATMRLSRVDQYRSRVAPAGLGKGVIVGIIDTGVDGGHAAFDGRLLECWNQLAKTSTPEKVPWGAVEDAATTKDSDGHGTHVAGIIAGNHGQIIGMAPEATLIAVKMDFEDAHIISGIRYVFRRASELGMPAVVNLSLGGHGDPHDGSDSLSRAIDEMTGPGRLVVAAAGNEGLDNIHFVQIVGNGTTHVSFRVPHHATRVVLNLWYDGDGDLEVAVSTPFGISTDYQATREQPKPATHIYKLASLARVLITTPGVNALNGDKSIRIALQSVTELGVHPGRWFLHFRNRSHPVTVHGWTIDDSPWGDVAWFEPSNTHLIGSPGAAASAITAAAFISRNAWTTEDGREWSVKFDLDTISPTSSRGPLRKADTKPDFAVAGGMVLSARSAQADFDEDMRIDAERVAMAGTSMATAVLTGMCATILERHPQWGPPEVKEALKITSRGTYSHDDGWGLVCLDRCP